MLGTVWRGNKEDPDTKEIRDTATLCRLSDIGAGDVIEAMLGAQMVDPRGRSYDRNWVMAV